MSGRLIVMGSGEISPTMVATHRWGLEESGQNGVTIIDTPYGFQENADELSSRIADFFEVSLNAKVGIASLRSREHDSATRETFLADVHRSSYLFAGPGSPTYALGIWREVGLADVIRNRLGAGATVVMASAAALTIGLKTLPVYEIYKVGLDPHWEDGLDVSSSLFVPMVVVPHWNNAEGGTHDTSHCFIGSRRFGMLESQLDVGVMGVDEHTAAALDFSAGKLTVSGVGTVTLRGAVERVIPSGVTVGLEEVADLLGGSTPAKSVSTEERTDSFDLALGRGDLAGALDRALELEAVVAEGSAEDRPLLRRALAELTRLAQLGSRDDRNWLRPLVELALTWRDQARANHDWATADQVRDVLLQMGVEVRDTQAGSEWSLAQPDHS